VAALEHWIGDHVDTGVVEVTAGVRSLQVHVDPDVLALDDLVHILEAAETELPGAAEAEVDSRVVHLPLSWDDPSTREAIARYSATVRPDAPWCPWNIEFIRRINGLSSVDDVHRVVFDASYLVLGLGDVYLGAPVAVPLDPRHRLVTTKYNPARTWTPENAVGIGGAYMCVYGMEGPGGYQLVGRTVQVWNRFHRTAEFTEPWLLRPFDRIRFFPVTADELTQWRRDLPVGRASLTIEPGRLRLAEQDAFEGETAESIAAFRRSQQEAFAAERARWAAMGEFDRLGADPGHASGNGGRPPVLLPAGAVSVDAALSAAVWKVLVEVGDEVAAGDPVVVLEAMKMEATVEAPLAGTVTQVLVQAGGEVEAGAPLLVVQP
jgi:urea carboxylase